VLLGWRRQGDNRLMLSVREDFVDRFMKCVVGSTPSKTPSVPRGDFNERRASQ